MATVFMILFLLTSVILTLMVLIQRGRGGGLAGAFGGAGGSSAFGTKTADVLVKATAVLGAIFFLLSIITMWIVRHNQIPEAPAASAPAEAPPTTPATPEAPGAGQATPSGGAGTAPAPAGNPQGGATP